MAKTQKNTPQNAPIDAMDTRVLIYCDTDAVKRVLAYTKHYIDQVNNALDTLCTSLDITLTDEQAAQLRNCNTRQFEADMLARAEAELSKIPKYVDVDKVRAEMLDTITRAISRLRNNVGVPSGADSRLAEVKDGRLTLCDNAEAVLTERNTIYAETPAELVLWQRAKTAYAALIDLKQTIDAIAGNDHVGVAVSDWSRTHEAPIYLGEGWQREPRLNPNFLFAVRQWLSKHPLDHAPEIPQPTTIIC